jgi:hypothetical protein
MDGVRRWDTPAGERLRPEPSGSLAWAGDHTLLANCAILDVATGGVRPLGHNEIQNSTVIDARHALTSGFDRRLRIWDLERPSHPVAVLEAADAAHVVRVDPAGRRAISRGGAADARIELWDVANVQAAARTANVAAPTDVILSNHRDRIAVQQPQRHSTLLMTATLEPIARLDGMPVAFRPGTDELLTGTSDAPSHDSLRRYSSRTGAQLGAIPCPDSSDQAWIGAFSRDGAATAIACQRSLWVREHDGDPWHAVERARSSLELFQIALDDRGHLVTGHGDGALRIWDRSRPAGEIGGNLLVTQRRHDASIASLEIRGDTVFTFSRDQVLRQWAIPSGEPRGRAYVRFDAAAMSPNGLPGRRLAAVAGGGPARGRAPVAVRRGGGGPRRPRSRRTATRPPRTHRCSSGSRIRRHRARDLLRGSRRRPSPGRRPRRRRCRPGPGPARWSGGCRSRPGQCHRPAPRRPARSGSG